MTMRRSCSMFFSPDSVWSNNLRGLLLRLRERDTWNNLAFAQARSQYRWGILLILAKISLSGRTDLHIILNRDLSVKGMQTIYSSLMSYISLQLLVISYARSCQPLCSSTYLSGTCLKNTLPTCTPVLNPIKHVRHRLKWCIAARRLRWLSWIWW